MLEWITSASWIAGQKPMSTLRDLIAPDQVDGLEFAFWPLLLNGREPDVGVLISCGVDPLVLCIEVKYLSGMSDVPLLAGDRGDFTGNQIADQQDICQPIFAFMRTMSACGAREAHARVVSRAFRWARCETWSPRKEQPMQA